jgi:hypothetical protein
VAAIFSAESGRPVRYEAVEEADFVAAMGAMGMPPDASGLIASLYVSVREGQAAAVLPTVEQVTGRAPISFRQFVRDVAAGSTR